MYNDWLRAHLVASNTSFGTRITVSSRWSGRHETTISRGKTRSHSQRVRKKIHRSWGTPKMKGPFLLFWKKIRGPTQIISLAYRFISAGFLPTYFFSKDQSCWAASSYPAQQEQSFIASILISRFLNKGTTDISFCLHTTSQFSVQQQESSRKKWGLYVCVILAMTCTCAFENTTKNSMSLGMAKSIQISWHHSTLCHPSSLMLNSFTSTVQLRCFGRKSANKKSHWPGA